MNFLTEVKGWTPIIDALAQETSLSVAAVYGAVWRYCQLEDEVCYASVEKIAKRACVSDRTAIRNLKILVKLGYLIDTTPDLRNKPHTYKDSGKAKIIGLVEARITKSDPQPAIADEARHDTKKGMTPCQSRYDTLSDPGMTPCQLKRVHKESIQDSKERAADAADPAPEPEPVPVKEKKKQKTIVPDAVKVFRDNAHRYPAKSWYADVVEAVGAEQADLERWGATVKAWVGQGWNPTNVSGMLDCYRRQEMPGANGKRNGGNYGNRQGSNSPAQPIPSLATGLGTPISDEFPDGWQPGDE